MAALRGSVPFQARGQEMALRAGFAAMERFSAATGKAFVASVQRLEQIADDPEVPGLLVDLAAAMLLPATPREEIPEIIDEIGLKPFLELVGAAVTAAFPVEAEGAVAARP